MPRVFPQTGVLLLVLRLSLPAMPLCAADVTAASRDGALLPSDATRTEQRKQQPGLPCSESRPRASPTGHRNPARENSTVTDSHAMHRPGRPMVGSPAAATNTKPTEPPLPAPPAADGIQGAARVQVGRPRPAALFGRPRQGLPPAVGRPPRRVAAGVATGRDGLGKVRAAASYLTSPLNKWFPLHDLTACLPSTLG